MTESFAELFEESFASLQIKPGSIITGTVVAVNEDVVIVSAGLKSEAVISIEQFHNDKGEAEVSVGDEIEVALETVEDGFGETRLSREKAIRARTWTELEKAFEKGEVVQGSSSIALGRLRRFPVHPTSASASASAMATPGALVAINLLTPFVCGAQADAASPASFIL